MGERDDSQVEPEVGPTERGASETGLARRDVFGALGALVGLSAVSGCAPGSGSGGGSTTRAFAVLVDTNLQRVDTIASLVAILSPVGAAIVEGYATPGDRGGGLFYFDGSSSATADGGTILAPSEGSGRWIRIYEGPLSVKWFGAKGNGSINDTAAIQAAIDAAERATAASTVFIPSGAYRVSAGNRGYALHIRKTMLLQGEGGQYDLRSSLQIDDSSKTKDLLLIEGDAPNSIVADGTQVKNVDFRSVNGTKMGRYGIVVHASYVCIEHSLVANTGNFGILIESGSSSSGGYEGSTALPSGNPTFADFWRLRDVSMNYCGDTSTSGAFSGGGGIRAHGEDSNGGIAISCSAIGCNIGFYDGSLGGGTWLSCYSQAAPIGFLSKPGCGSLFIGCYSEDTVALSVTTPGSSAPNATHVTVGGDIDNADRVHGTRVAGPSRMTFSAKNPAESSSISYDAQVPVGSWKAAMSFSRNTSSTYTPRWTLGYDPNAYFGKVWAFYLRPEGATVDRHDVYGAPFGFTDHDHERGPGLPFFARPLLNTRRRWTWRQRSVTLTPGMNVVQTGFFWFGGSDSYMPDADARISATVEFPVSDSGTTSDGHASTANLYGPSTNYSAYSARLATLTNHPIKVGAAMPLWREYGGSMWGVQVYNDGSNNVTVDVVWHCELFQTSTAPDSSGWPTAP